MKRLKMTVLAALAALAIAGSGLFATDTALAKQDKVDVCHETGAGAVMVLSLPEKAAAAHLAHGDTLAVDGACDGGTITPSGLGDE